MCFRSQKPKYHYHTTSDLYLRKTLGQSKALKLPTEIQGLKL